MQKKPSTKNLIILGAVILVAILAYFYFSGAPTDSSAQLTDSDITPSPVTNEATKILTLLNDTSALHIDTALFNSPVYKSLVDHTVPVLEQPVGKPNPFFYTIPTPATPGVIKK